MATTPGYDDPDDAPGETCHRHPLGCPDRRCKRCRQPTVEKSSICLDCQASRQELVSLPPDACVSCGKVAPLVATFNDLRGGRICRPCALAGLYLPLPNARHE